MKKIITLFLSTIFAAAITTSCDTTPAAPQSIEQPSAEEVMATTKKVAEWQLDRFEHQGKYRTLEKTYKDREWNHRNKYSQKITFSAMLFDGLYQFSTISDDGQKYVDWVAERCEENNYELENKILTYEDLTISSLYIELAELYNKPEFYTASRALLDRIVDTKSMDAYNWQVCDYIYMSAPAFAQMSEITGESKYIEWMDSQIHKCYELLYDKEERLFYRDNWYKSQLDDYNNKAFWSRANGWVLVGLTKLIPHFGEGSESRKFYEDLFYEIAERLCELQQENGSWPISLLSEVSKDQIETSATSLIAYGLGWGLNNGLLEGESYEQTLYKAWYLLESAVREDGLIGYTQCVKNGPADSGPNFTEIFTAGSFLSAATELYKYID